MNILKIDEQLKIRNISDSTMSICIHIYTYINITVDCLRYITTDCHNDHNGLPKCL